MKVERFTISCSLPLKRQIDRQAKRLGLSRSEFVAKACEAYMSEAAMMARLAKEPEFLGAFAKAFMQPGVAAAFSRAMEGEVDPQQLRLFMEGLKR